MITNGTHSHRNILSFQTNEYSYYVPTSHCFLLPGTETGFNRGRKCFFTEQHKALYISTNIPNSSIKTLTKAKEQGDNPVDEVEMQCKIVIVFFENWIGGEGMGGGLGYGLT